MFRQSIEKDPKQLTADDLSPVGTLVHIVRYKKDGDSVLFLAQGKARVAINEVLQTEPFMKAQVSLLEDKISDNFGDMESEALVRSANDLFSQIVTISSRYQEEFAIIADNIDHPGRLADYIASIISLKTEDKQQLLENVTVEERLEKPEELINSHGKAVNANDLILQLWRHFGAYLC